MKSRKTGIFALICLFTLASSFALAKKNGTDVFHFSLRIKMESLRPDSDIEGSVEAEHKAQGAVEHQSVRVVVNELRENSSFQLLAKVGDDTNLMHVADFETDEQGSAELFYSLDQHPEHSKHDKPHKLHKEPKLKPSHAKKDHDGDDDDDDDEDDDDDNGNVGSLPDILNPVSGIRELVVANVNTQALLVADFGSPDKLQYLVVRDLNNEGVDPNAEGLLRIKSNGKSDQFQLRADGLNSSAPYFLAINDAVAKRERTDEHGRLEFKELPPSAPAILDITRVEIWNNSSNTVLGTTLP